MSKKSLQIIAVLIIVPLGVYIALNAVALYKFLNYKLRPEKYCDQDLMNTVKAIKNSSVAEEQKEVLLGWGLEEDTLYYPKLGIIAPIIWDVIAEEANQQMNFGITHILGTAKPGYPGGILISGHSSYYWWQRGDYKDIFVNLGSAEVSDVILVRKDGLHIYEVDNVYEIPSSQELLFSSAGDSKLSLMTCVPIGTDLKRLIVEASLVSSI